MRVVERLPHDVREIEHLEIELADGCRLAARLWLPCSADRHPVPAILEYIPYRKRDGTRLRDERMHRYFAGHGFAVVRVDVRGSGDSSGVLRDEYLPIEQRDGVAVIEWIAAQAWCSGAVGMIGKSWGGFSALQIAARRPDALRCLVVLCAADDRYADDAHYMGGCLLGENILWGSYLFTLMAQPPDPQLVADWRAQWLVRLDEARPPLAVWLRHPHRDAYWRQGSVAEDIGAITCPVFAVSGWADGYTNAVFRLLERLRVPRRGLIGPWAHLHPHEGRPGPAIGFLQEAVRWFDHWLRGEATGLLDEPMLRVYVQDSVAPSEHHHHRPGRFVAEQRWPSARIATHTWCLGDRELVPMRCGPRLDGPTLSFRSPLDTGLRGGAWCSFGEAGDDPADQRADDARSLVFDTAPLDAALEIVGAPVFTCLLAADAPAGQIAVRLCDVAADGASLLVCYGLLDLTHRQCSEQPRPMVAGQTEAVRVVLNHCGHRFLPGRRMRLAVSTAWWPIAWPAADATTLTLTCGGSQLELPVRTPSADDGAVDFAEPEQAAAGRVEELQPDCDERLEQRDHQRGQTTLRRTTGRAVDGSVALERIVDIDLCWGHGVRHVAFVAADDPLSARVEVEHEVVRRRGGWSVRIVTRTELSCDRDRFHLRSDLIAFEGDQRRFARTRIDSVPRVAATPPPG